ncbi:MAG: lipocalin family protein [Spirochaetes bacterium]|nr:lipocalin family protein [Spirochaetota bacterium]
MNYFLKLICLFTVVMFSACSSAYKEVEVVNNFSKEKYLGKWYEIARMDFKYEKDLNNTTAEYSAIDGNKIKVVNRGYNYKTGEWKEAVGKAKFKTTEDKGELLVSFFGPFYGAYNIVELDPDYQYSLVMGGSETTLWILSRSKTIPSQIKEKYLTKAKELGFDVSKFIWVEHNK